MTARLRETYKSDVFTALKDKFNYANVNEVPKLVKITINMGLGEAKENSKIMESAIRSQSRTSRLDRECQLEQRLHLEATTCTCSLISSSTSLFQE